MNDKRSWQEFQDSGLFWWINMLLHTFGWAIVIKKDNGVVTEVYPARVKFRGFSEENNTHGYQKVSNYMKENAEELYKESMD